MPSDYMTAYFDDDEAGAAERNPVTEMMERARHEFPAIVHRIVDNALQEEEARTDETEEDK